MNLVVNVVESSVKNIVNMMSTTIYNYFKKPYGTLEICDNGLNDRYNDFLAKDLKKPLRFLKSSNIPIPEIKFLSSRRCKTAQPS